VTEREKWVMKTSDDLIGTPLCKGELRVGDLRVQHASLHHA